MRVIKRYANRKLYDTKDRRYVTLARISEWLRAGEDVQIIDNATGRDVTSVALSQILTDRERREQGAVPASYLAEIVRRGTGALSQAVKRSSSALTQAVVAAEEELERRVRGLARAGEITQKESRRVIEELREGARHNRQLVESRFEESVRGVLSRLDIPSRRDVAALEKRIEELTKKLEKKQRGTAPRRPAAARRPAKKRAPARKAAKKKT